MLNLLTKLHELTKGMYHNMLLTVTVASSLEVPQ